MTAIFTGLGAGLVRSSATELGGAGTLGSAVTGRGGEGLSVNAATGNLVISRRDEFLAGRSLDVGISRTYNSLAEVHDGDNGDKWQMSTARRVFGLTGSQNTAGSTIKRVSGDGSVVTYKWGTRGGVASYWATEGSGAHDRIYKSGATWIWQEGSSRIKETYSEYPAGSGEFRITKQTDRDNQSLVFGYSGSKLSYVKTNNGEYVRYTWSGNKVTSIKTEFAHPRTGTTITETGTYYAYDGNGRLATVKIDLSPEKAGTSDGHKFTISYLYDSAGRVTRMTQSDGSRTDISYDASGRVSTLTEHVGDGSTRVTRFAYGTNYTNVTAPNNQVTRLDYHATTKLLTKITAPAAYIGAAKQVQTFTYDSARNLTQSVAPDGRVTKYTYDDRGNVTKIDRPIGTDVTKWYDAENNVTRELSYGSNEGSANVGSYVRYAYDGEGHLRYKVTAEGHVTEYRYDSYGRLVWEGRYTKYSYAHSSALISESGMNAWRDGLADKTQVDWFRNHYDARGNLTMTTNYGAGTSTGGASGSGALEGYTRTYYVYDEQGRLITRYNHGESGKEQFVYDGMGRLVSSTDSAGAATSVFFDDGNTSTVIQMASGLTRTMVYNKAGDLISETESSVGPMSANLAPALTSWGKSSQITRTATTAIAGKPAYRYDIPAGGSYGNTNRHTSVAAGETVKFKITIMGTGTQTRHRIGLHGNSESWGTSKDTQTQATIIDGPGRLSRNVGGLWWIDGISATTPTTIELTRTYEVAQTARGYFYVGGSGTLANGASVILSNPIITKTTTDAALDFTATTTNKYDKLGRLRVTQDMFDGRGVNYIIYDKAGRKVGVVDPARRLTEYFYDKSNRLTGTVTYANAISTTRFNQLADPNNTLEMSAIRPATNGIDVRSFTTYDANGRVAQRINGQGEIVSYSYDNSGRLVAERNHHNKVTIASAWLTNPPADPVSIGNHSKDAVTRTFYDRDGNVRGMLDGEGYLTEYVYDESGRKIRDIGYVTRTSSAHWASGTFNQLRGTASPNNANNRSTRYIYNGRGQLRFQVDSANYLTQFTYNYAGRLTKTTQHINPLASNFSNWTIAGVKAALSTSSSDRAATNYYDFAGRLWRTLDPNGLDTRFYFDHAGNVVKTTVGNRTTRAWHDARGNVRFSLDAEGYLTSYLYNEGGQVTHERRFDGKKSASDSTTIAQAAALASGGYSQNRYVYDSHGRVLENYDAAGTRTRFVYRVNGQLMQTIRAYGTADSSITYDVYDKAGRLARREHADGQSEQSITYFTYDGLGNQIQVKDGNGRISHFTYDKRGLLLTEKNGAGNQIRYEHNAFGDIVKTWDAKNVLASEHVYDKRGLVTRTYDALRNHTNYSYTQFGEVKTVTDPRGAVTTFTYDKLGRVLTTKDGINKTETYTYDAYGNRISVKNKLGGTTSYVYDKLGRMTQMTDANGIKTTYAYDARGNRTQMTEAATRAEARTTTYTYDRANRLTQTSVQGFSGNYVTQYAYDKRGNVVRQIAPDGGKTIYFYDDLDRVTVEINALGTYTAYTYDKNSNVKTVKVYESPVAVPSTGGAEESQPAAPTTGTYRETRFDYDAANRMTKSHVMGVTSRYYTGTALQTYSGTTLTTEYVYDANGNVVQTIDPNGGKTWAYYDAMGRKQHQVDAENYRTTWTYDGAGNVIREIRYANKTATPTSTTSVPGVSGNSSIDRRTDYGYDLVGNRTSEKRFYVKYHNGSGGYDTGHATISYQYNGLGQVTKKTEAVSGNVTDYTYDAGGRLTKETRAAFLDFNGQSVRPVVDYYYDGLDNLTRTRQRGATGATERNTYYYYTKGKLQRMTDAGGLTRYYNYDSAGRETEVYYTRKNYSNVSRTEGVKRSYDKLGRVVSEFRGTKSGNSWTAVGPTTTTTYNAYGQVASVKVGTGAAQINTYDKGGRLVKTNAGDGVYKLFAHDRNGNQTAAITSAGYQLSGRTFANSLSLVSRADVNITYTTYDKRGSARLVYETDRDLSATVHSQTLKTDRRYNAFGEVAYEKNALGADIYYDYTTMGKVWRVRNASVSIQNEDGSTSTGRVYEHYYHDLGGRLVAASDGNGNLTRYDLLNGTGFGGGEALITAERFIDGGVKTTKYDIHGDARRLISVADGRAEAYRTIEQTFDRMGRVTQTWNRGTNLQDNYTYDVIGQQLSHWNNVYGAGNREITDYDVYGRVVSSRAFGGDTTTTTYTWRKNADTNAVGDFGGWEEVTRTLANNRTLTEWTDLFGRTKRRNDFGGHNYTYTYDTAGRLSGMSGNGGNQQYVYYNTGKLKSIANVTGVLNSQNFQELKTTYGYDKVGNLTSQKTTDRGSTHYLFYWNQYEPEYYTQTWNRTTQNQTATYDLLGRIKTWNEAGGGDLPAASMSWTYDANGNIRRANASYRHILSDQSVSTYTSTQDNWYRYDNMNRVVTSRGQLVNGQIVRGSQGRDIVYNKAGQRTQVLTTSRESYRWYYDPYGGEDIVRNEDFDDGPGSFQPINQQFGQGYWRTDYYDATVREDYKYDNGGRLKQVDTAKSGFNGLAWEQANEFGIGIGGSPSLNIQDYVGGVPANGSKKADYSYDILSRVTLQRDWSGTTNVYSRNVYYNAEGLVTREDSTTRKGSDSYRANQYNYYNADNTQSSSLTYNYKNGSTSGVNNTRTTNTYAWYDGAVQSRVDFDSNTSSSSDRVYNSTYAYNSFGVLQSAQINDGRTRSVSFINSAEGQVISRKEKDNKHDQGDPSEIYYRFGGKEIGRVGNNGTANVNYEQSIGQRSTVTPTNPGAFRNGATSGSSYADFGGDYDAINTFSQGAAGGTYTVRGGENLQAIAAQLWGDSALWYKLAEANGLTGREPLIEGRSLVIPSGVQRVHNNANTLKPYDPAEAIGDTSPTTPDQPKKKGKKCGIFGQILLAVVAIAVTVVTSGALAAASISAVTGSSVSIGAGLSALAGATVAGASITTVGAITIGAAAAAAGSIASQGLGVATGIQDKFSWKAVGLAAIGGAVSAGVGPRGVFGKNGLFGKGTFAAAGRGAVSSAVSQGVGVATGLQDKFSWAGVAAAGVGAGAGHAASGLAGDAGHGIAKGLGLRGGAYLRASEGISRGLTGAASAIASAATQSAIDGSSFGRNLVAAVPNVVASALQAYASACFVGETLIQTPSGLKRIDEIRVGDLVYSRDEDFEDERVQTRRVIQLYCYDNRVVLDLTVAFEDGEETFRATPEHPFAVLGVEAKAQLPVPGQPFGQTGGGVALIQEVETHSWTPAGDLRAGDRVIDINGRTGMVVAIEPVGMTSTVHNFAVEDHHTYFVGETGTWVHNQYMDVSEELNPRRRLLRNVENVQMTLELIAAQDELTPEARLALLEAARTGLELFDETLAYERSGGFISDRAGELSSTLGIIAGFGTGAIETGVDTLDALLSPLDTLRGLFETGEDLVGYIGRVIDGDANPLTDAQLVAVVFEAGIELERSRRYLAAGEGAWGHLAGNFLAGEHGGSEAMKVALSVTGVGALKRLATLRGSNRRAGGGFYTNRRWDNESRQKLQDEVGGILARRARSTSARYRANAFAEARGVVFAAYEAQRLGYTRIEGFMPDARGHGVDMIVSDGRGGFAIFEAKGGWSQTGPGSLGNRPTPNNPNRPRQGTHAYNIDRLNKVARNANNPNSGLARQVLGAYRNNNVTSYATFYGSRTTQVFTGTVQARDWVGREL